MIPPPLQVDAGRRDPPRWATSGNPKTTSGEVVTGRIEREDESVVSIRPLAANEEVVAIRKTEINQRTVSKISNMPPGMLNILDEAQILDLLAYLISDGESAHEKEVK